MVAVRVMPCLLLRKRSLVKTVRFRNPKYIGDPINTLRIFNEKEVDELILLDITATRENRPPQFGLIEEVATECFMPLTYGGGVRTIDDFQRLFAGGVEKVSVNTAVAEEPRLIERAAERFGSQSIVVSMDVRRTWFGRSEVRTRAGSAVASRDPTAYAQQVVRLGAGEILLTSIDRDGTMGGYDLDLIRRVTQSVSVPVIACGGAGTLSHLRDAVCNGGASAVAAGSMVVYQGVNRAVLVNFPERATLDVLFDLQPPPSPRKNPHDH